MKLLIVSEGRHELQTKDVKGALEVLVGRMIGEFTCDKRVVSDRSLPRMRGGGLGYFKRARQWMQLAQRQGYDAVILVVDQDDYPIRRIELDRGQEDNKCAIARALGIAIRTFDAWMLADEVSLTKAIGKIIWRQPDPEDNSDPKGDCERINKEWSGRIGVAAMYAEIARELDLEVLKKRCPKGFAPFAERVRKLRVQS